MLYKKTTEMWLQKIANLPIKYKYYKGKAMIKSEHKSYPARMMMKVKRLKFIDK